MTTVNRPSIHATRPPKPTWGPGRNAALSFVAFALIFGLFAYVERDARDERGSAIHEASGVVTRSISKTDKYAAAANIRPDIASAESATRAASPPAMTSPVTVVIEPEAAPRAEHQASAAPAVPPLPAPPVVAARRAHAAPAAGPISGRVADVHRLHQHPRPHALTSARQQHVTVASRPHPSGVGTARMPTTSVTRQELEGARALARARSCAVRDNWGCVEQNASRALAIDPQNSESRALLGRAVRNRS
ncbi:hypothetical protein LFL97_36720 [Burkholderia sp. JSH-S8]|nr:hypothetical protein LFL97_36720 [Burkholderia sp. JSH-S8]